ncbi:hypothetical protein E4656_09440 [Natronospirillum operosum]|uniref:DUF4139 domain-containing protein n=1 Tax=Natronospirillum operosum TaxID=2759953 RepID=A0A4Z0WEB2_9GAMM|nr:hypothetical protein [Natronospirillum operosum]TGG93271.1 hypothetical protein E4656_09440 [Natronospirillum operosum]
MDSVSIKAAAIGSRLTALGLALSLSLTAMAADWLYLSPAGGWVEQSVTVDAYPFTLEIPGHADRLWWSPEAGDGDLVRERYSEVPVMEPGTDVVLAASVRLPGIGPLVAGDRLTIRQFLGDRVVVSVDDKAVVLGPDVYSNLSFQVTPLGMDRVRLQADRDTPDTRRLAWSSSLLSADVRYRLQMAGDGVQLRQYLRVSNDGDQALNAPGLSWFPGGAEAVETRTMMMESVAVDSRTEVASGPVAALTVDESVRLPARTESWLLISEQPVSASHHYSLNWDTRQGEQTARAAEWRVRLQSEADLPRLAGAVELGWFDERLAAIDSYYRRAEARRAELSLGRNNQVTLNAQPGSAGEAELAIHNHLDAEIEVALQITHQPNRQVPPLTERRTVSVPPGVVRLEVRFDDSSLQVR